MNTIDNSIICAITTPPGMGAMAVIRVSGAGSIALCDQLFISPSRKKLTEVPPNTVHFGKIILEESHLDDVLISVFHAPRSFTGEDTVEISCHGSTYIQQKLLQLLMKTGARMAQPGEFSRRAFLNGKVDLAQAEAIADLIASSSAASHRIALNQMRGGFSNELSKLRQELLHVTSLLELELDFSEEDVEFANRDELLQLAQKIRDLILKLKNSYSLGNVLKNGVSIAIVGPTNVGKSTLLNTLLGDERAIVSDIAGTTRDVIEDSVVLDGITFRFIDTAGIRQTTDEIEHIGIERTFVKVAQVHVVLLVVDARIQKEEFLMYYRQIKERLSSEAKLFVVLNKVDQQEGVDEVIASLQSHVQGETIIPISAKTGYQIDHLIKQLTNVITNSPIDTNDVIVTNMRHYEALSHANQAIDRVIESLKLGLSGEFISQDSRECLHHLGEITGEITTDEILGNIFKNFCIGK